MKPVEIWPAIREHIRKSTRKASTGEQVEIIKAAEVFIIYADAMPDEIKTEMLESFNADAEIMPAMLNRSFLMGCGVLR